MTGGNNMARNLSYTIETVEAIEEYYADDVYMQIYILNELYRYTDDDRYRSAYERICHNNCICDRCFSPLQLNKHFERRGDDYTYNEEIIEYVCKKCD